MFPWACRPHTLAFLSILVLCHAMKALRAMLLGQPHTHAAETFRLMAVGLILQLPAQLIIGRCCIE